MSDTASNSGGGAKIGILYGAVLVLAGATVYSYYQVSQIRMELVETRELLATEIAGVQETSTISTQTSKRTVESLEADLEATKQQAAQLAGQARTDALRHADDLANKLERLQEEQAAELEQSVTAVADQVNAVKQDTNVNRESVTAVSTEVAAVKTQAAATKAELDKTIAALTSTQGDLGVQSGLIATNARELAALRALGEREYVEFRLKKAKTNTKIGDLLVRLTKSDQKKNRYTVEVIANDKKVEKKDRTVNEPVQFLLPRSRFPYELVVNEVNKDEIVGYLSVPKAAGTTQARN